MINFMANVYIMPQELSQRIHVYQIFFLITCFKFDSHLQDEAFRCVKG